VHSDEAWFDTGLGLQKGKFLHYSKSDAMIQLMQTVKKTIDPNGIMNPYKYLPDAK
jgi:FAD/FMN-containing dehydrogenase